MTYSLKYYQQNALVRNYPIVYLLVFILCWSFSSKAETLVNTPSLTVTPNQCVALRQGQDCYVDVEIKWQAKIGNYCLHSSQQASTLQCWDGQKTGQYRMEIIANTDVLFYLKRQSMADTLAEAKVEMAWVYKKNSRAHLSWRMF